MNSALIHGLLASDACKPSDLAVATRTVAKAEELSKATGIRVAERLETDASGADAIVLGVKQPDVAVALAPFRSVLAGHLLVSLAAGVRIASLTHHAPGAQIVRAMPNTPLQCGAGMTVLSSGEDVSENQLRLAEQVFSTCGEVAKVPEAFMDAVTAVSGSGPAYFFLMMEALADAGVTAGLPRPLASKLAVQTAFGASKLAVESGSEPSLLREKVMSPGGTTAAALHVLESKALRGAMVDAVLAARDRAEELGRLA